MPGLIGFVSEFSPDVAIQLLTDMAHALHPEEGYHVDLYHDEDVGLGRISLDMTGPETQPIWNEDRSICIVMEGEVFDYQDWKEKLITIGHNFRSQSDAEFVLHLYEEIGKDFALRLNGAFSVAIWNVKEKRLVIANDRFGLRPIYYTTHHGSIFFASGMRALFVDPHLDRNIDRLAIAQLLTFDYILGNRTLLCNARLLPPASVLTFVKDRLDIHTYWKLEFHDNCQPLKETEYMEGLIYHLRQAVARQAPGDMPAGVLLSGGLDSRVIAAFLCEQHSEDSLHTFTFGIPGCDDDRLAREVAKVLGTNHYFFDLKPDFLVTLGEEGVRLTDGMMNCLAIVALANLLPQAELASVLYKGYMGDALLGGHLKRQLWSNHNEDTTVQMLFDEACALFSLIEQKELFTEDFQSKLGDGVYESFRNVLVGSKIDLIANRQNHFDICQRQRRYILNGVELVRSRVVARTPFCDNDLFDFMLSVPPGFRLERYLLIQAFIQQYPDLAKVPITPTGIPLKLCLRDIQIRFNRLIIWHLHSIGLIRFPTTRLRPYVEYENWMRTALRSWVKETLLDGRVEERGYYKPGYIRKLISDHMNGNNHSRKLGMLITIELWHRQFID